MSLPDPIPDDPRKWDGWRTYNSSNYYERLGLSYEENPSDTQIEENCRQLLVWWQKKLPLKNQPSNPLAQLLRDGLDEAPQSLVAARTILLNPDKRLKFDETLAAEHRETNLTELRKYVNFAVSSGVLRELDEQNLRRLGHDMGFSDEDIDNLIAGALEEKQATRERELPEAAEGQFMSPSFKAYETPTHSPWVPPQQEEQPPYQTPAPQQPRRTPQQPRRTSRVRRTARFDENGAAAPASQSLSPEDEFRRILQMSGLLDEGMSDDQRQALANMGHSLGLDEMVAEDIIDDYLDEMFGEELSDAGAQADPNQGPGPASINIPPAQQEAMQHNQQPQQRRRTTSVQPISAASLGVGNPGGSGRTQRMSVHEERRNFPDFTSRLGFEMKLIPSGKFTMGSSGILAKPNERPEREVSMTRFYMARFPVTNALFERYDASHKTRRNEWSKDDHPVVNVTSQEAIEFCKWLTKREDDGAIWRLPSEAEWEYAAKGKEKREYPWGTAKGRGDLGNFADSNTRLAWSDNRVDDGFAHTSPVGSYPKGVSAFGIEDMGGNVWEWVRDFYGPYKADDTQDPRGPVKSDKRVCRGGSFRSKFTSMRCAGRHFFALNYQFIDLGFRVVREADVPPPQR